MFVKILVPWVNCVQVCFDEFVKSRIHHHNLTHNRNLIDSNV